MIPAANASGNPLQPLTGEARCVPSAADPTHREEVPMHPTALKSLLSLALATPLLAVAQTPATLDKVKASGEITLAYRESSIPFSYLDDKAQPVGFGFEICQKIVDDVKKATGRADLKVNLQAVTSANRIPLLQNGTIDIECGSTTNNSERGKQVQFATNYFYTGTRFLVKTGTQVKSIDDLKGKTVVSTTGTTNYKILRGLNEEKKLGIDLLAAKDHAESALMVESGRAVAFGMDDILLYGLRASAQNPAALAVVGEPIQVEPYAIMLRRDDPAFKKLVDGTLANLMKSGEFTKLYTKWFQSPIPPKGINLNAPMSQELIDNMKALSDKPAT
jgi:ABC-type amino acid transport substrate-binding protein